MDFEFRNERQTQFYEQLCRRTVPSFFRDLLAHPHAFMHFSVALYVFWKNHEKHRPWTEEKIVRPMRHQIGQATKGQVKALAQSSEEAIGYDEWLRCQCLTAAFAVNVGDQNAAVRIMSQIAGVLLDGNFIADAHLPTLNLLLMLIRTQRYTRTWGAFIQALCASNQEARRVFSDLFEFWHVNRELPEFIPVSRLPDGINKPANLDTRLDFAVPDECAQRCNTLFRDMTDQFIPANTPVASLLGELWTKREELQNRADQMWSEVIRDANCDLHPEGNDCVEIQIDSLRSQGARFIQLVPESKRPDALAMVWCESPISHRRFHLDYPLRDADLGFATIDSAQLQINLLIRCLYRYLGIASVWMVCMGHFRKERERMTSLHLATSTTAFHKVPRPHFRQIDHLGQHASAAAIQRCLAHYQGLREPPVGKTFVKPTKAPTRMSIKNIDPAAFSMVCRINDSHLSV